MKKLIFIFTLLLSFALMSNSSCNEASKSSDKILQEKTEQTLREANRQLATPAITNFQEKKNLKWIYELCDTENLVCYAYLWNEYNGKMVFIGKCIGYGIPYSTQYSNPEKYTDDPNGNYSAGSVIMPQAEPNGLFKPVGLSATWLIMIDPKTNEPRPVYIEPEIIVSPYPLL